MDLQRIWPVAVALAKRAWLAGTPERIAELVAEPYRLAVERRHDWAIGELGCPHEAATALATAEYTQVTYTTSP